MGRGQSRRRLVLVDGLVVVAAGAHGPLRPEVDLLDARRGVVAGLADRRRVPVFYMIIETIELVQLIYGPPLASHNLFKRISAMEHRKNRKVHF